MARRNLVLRLPRILFAYAAAMLASATVIGIYGFVLGSIGLAKMTGHGDDLLSSTGVMLAMIVAIALFVGFMALVPSALAVAVAEITRLRTWLYFTAVGMLLAHLFASSWGIWPFGASTKDFASSVQGGLNSNYLVIVVAGALGGLVYWHMAERRT